MKMILRTELIIKEVNGMVWLFIITTIVTFSFVLKYVLSNIMLSGSKNTAHKNRTKALSESKFTAIHTYK
jgi:hypothetical protein